MFLYESKLYEVVMINHSCCSYQLEYLVVIGIFISSTKLIMNLRAMKVDTSLLVFCYIFVGINLYCEVISLILTILGLTNFKKVGYSRVQLFKTAKPNI